MVCGTPFIPSSTGTVISRSTSSAACPGHCVTISTIGGDRSGYASIGRRFSAHTPAPTSTRVSRMMIKRCPSEAATMRFISDGVRGGTDPVDGSGSLIGFA